MRRELFIYWRVTHGDCAGALDAATRFQARLRETHPGIVARLYRRADDPVAMPTLMETYALPAGFDDALQASIVAAAEEALGSWCSGGRHVESFERLGG